MSMSKLLIRGAQRCHRPGAKRAILCLSEEDRNLPAIDQMLTILQRGIAVHHSGLLPIIKARSGRAVVAKLFSRLHVIYFPK